MDTMKIMRSALVMVVLLSLSAVTVSASQGRRMNQTAREEALVVSELPELTDEDRVLLEDGQREERLARDVYLAFYDLYGAKVFSNIANSEQQHLDAIGRLLTAYDIPQTEGYGDLQPLYDTLIAQGKESLEAARSVGIIIEQRDIADIESTLGKTDNTAIKQVLENLKRGSEHHLKAFSRDTGSNNTGQEVNGKGGKVMRGMGQRRG